MSFTLASLIVLGLGVGFLALLTYHLLTKLTAIEKAVVGGLTAPSRELSREEFGRRFAIAEARADFAAEIGTATVIFVDAAAAVTAEIMAVLRNMNQRRGFVLAVEAGTVDAPDDVTVLADSGHRFAPLGITATPFVLVVDNGTIVGSRPVGSIDAIRSLLLEVA